MRHGGGMEQQHGSLPVAAIPAKAGVAALFVGQPASPEYSPWIGCRTRFAGTRPHHFEATRH